MGIDAIDVVEAAYRVDNDLQSWLRGVLEAGRADLEDGAGALAYIYDARSASALRIPTVVSTDMDPALVDTYVATARSMPSWVIERTYLKHPGLNTSRQMLGGGVAAGMIVRLGMMRFRAADFRGVNVIDPTGCGVILGALTKGVHGHDRRKTDRWAQIAAHVAAGYRLQGALARPPGSEAYPYDGEAVFEPDGRLTGARGAAREQTARDLLRDAARAVDRARGALRRTDGDEALAIWRGLVAGRWSLVDHFDSDGRRYLVARRNDPETIDPRALAEGERQVVGYAALAYSNKLIAYHLGLNESTVAMRLRRAMKKLGVASRTELVSLMRGLRRAADADGSEETRDD